MRVPSQTSYRGYTVGDREAGYGSQNAQGGSGGSLLSSGRGTGTSTRHRPRNEVPVTPVKPSPTPDLPQRLSLSRGAVFSGRPGPGVSRTIGNLSPRSNSDRMSDSGFKGYDVMAGKPERLEMEKRCKPRPDDNRKKAGGGSGKRFVPWCK